MSKPFVALGSACRPKVLRPAIRQSVRGFLGLGRLLLAAGALAHAQPPPAPTKSTIVATIKAPAATDRTRTLHEDREFTLVAVDYGSGGPPQTPGLHVFDKKSQTWIRVDSVSLKGSVLGRAPTWEECRALGKNPPAVSWDFRSLAGRDHVDVPLRSSGCLMFPDKIERDDPKDRMILTFHSGWNLPSVRTVLVFSLTDLRRCFESR